MLCPLYVSWKSADTRSTTACVFLCSVSCSNVMDFSQITFNWPELPAIRRNLFLVFCVNHPSLKKKKERGPNQNTSSLGADTILACKLIILKREFRCLVSCTGNSHQGTDDVLVLLQDQIHLSLGVPCTRAHAFKHCGGFPDHIRLRISHCGLGHSTEGNRDRTEKEEREGRHERR